MAKKIYVGVPGLGANALGKVAEGSTVKIKENGVLVDFYVAKHNYETELNGKGRTLLMRKDCYDKRVWHTSNVNTYATSAIDNWLNGSYKNLIDPAVRSKIGTTKFRYTPGNGNNTVGTLERAVFTLSATELGRTASFSNSEGTMLPNASDYQTAKLNGSAFPQWTRSPSVSSGSANVCYLRSDGSVYGGTINSQYGSRPAFTLPSNMGVFDGTITGGTAEGSFAQEVKKIYVGVENFTPRELPAGYTQVEYIESSGTQHIDIGIKYTSANYNTLRIVLKSSYPSFTSNFWLVNGCSGTGGIFYFGAASGAGQIYYGNGTNVPTNKYAEAEKIHEWDFDAKNGKLVYDGETLASGITFSAPSVSLPLSLFGYYTTDTSVDKHTERIYSCQIYNNETMVRDFVPCRNSSGVVGLYDLIGKRFYQNAGTGTFIAGSAHISTAMKVKKAYIGIAGVARLFFGSGEIKYLKQLRNSSLDTSFNFPSPGKVGKYAVFASNSSSYLVVYDDMLTSKNVSVGVQKHALGDRNPGETIGNLLLFAPCSSGTRGNETLVINDSLTVLNSPQLIEYSYGGYRAENKKQWVINAGGQGQAINQSMTLQPISALTSLSNSLYDGTRAGTHAVFFGSTPYAVSQSLTLTKLNYQMMSSATGGLTLNDKAIFIEPSTSIFVTYDSSLTYTQLTVPNVGKPLSRNVGSHGVLQDKLILSCEDGTAFGICNESFTYEYKVRGLPTNKYCAMATNEKYAFWGGGLDDNGYFSEKITVLEMS